MPREVNSIVLPEREVVIICPEKETEMNIGTVAYARFRKLVDYHGKGII